jgi:anti-sigma regulatory factor (Ser/Thr protein kinase)
MLTIRCCLQNICALETFIHSQTDIPELERNKILLITNEIFENIIQHANPHSKNIRFKIYKGKALSLLFLFHSENFEWFVANVRKIQPYYDPRLNRYRGLGLKICYNLSSSIHYRATKTYNAVSVRL